MEKKTLKMEEENEALQKSLQESQAAAGQWTRLINAMEKTTLKKLLEETVKMMKKAEEESIKKADYDPEEATRAEEQIDYIQKLMGMISADGEKKDPLETVSDRKSNA